MAKGNVIVGQSGGPTSVINSSVAGVYVEAKKRGYEKVYGMIHGIEGLLQGKYMDLSEHLKTDMDVELLKRTPAAYLGSCRYKLPAIEGNEETYEKIFAILEELGVSVFIYTGGNDSMDTIMKLSDYAAKTGSAIRFMGCPKTIDNDLAHTDHTPGFGSAAKYIAASIKEVYRDGISVRNKKGFVTVVEIMGRNAGWLTAAAALAKTEDCPGPDAIYLPERDFDVEAFVAKVTDLIAKKGSAIVAVSEGIHTSDGKFVCELGSSSDYVDAFGHKQLSGTAQYLCNLLSSRLGCKTRGVEFSTLQRAANHMASLTDINEAFMAGSCAVKAADEGDSGKMVVFVRLSDRPYVCGTDVRDVHEIANDERLVPDEWITPDGDHITDDFIAYARPLIMGELTPVMVDGLPRHLAPAGYFDLM